MSQITTCFWFPGNMENAVDFYISIFPDAQIINKIYYGKSNIDQTGMEEGDIMTIKFSLMGQIFEAINGPSIFHFTPAISLVVNCQNQHEVDYYWEKLSINGEKGDCGWLIDKFGISWQIIPVQLEKLLSAEDEEQREYVISAMMKMKKIIIDDLYKK